MSTSTNSSIMPHLARFVAHLRIPLYRNAYALVFNSAATSALGLIYWVLAAHNYTTDTVGLNSALISTMIFLANISQLNLMNVLNRFVPSAGKATGRLVIYAYLASLIMGLVASLIFSLGVHWWTPTLKFIQSNPVFLVWFSLSVMAWCIFVLQDSVLVGLRQATWIPVENLIFALLKIGLLIGLTQFLPRYGLFASWTISVAVLLLPVNLFIFRQLIPPHVNNTAHQAMPILPKQLAKYIVSDYLSSLIWMATISLVPIMIINQVGTTATAHFYLAWTVAYTLYLLSRNMGMSLIAEASIDEGRLNVYTYRIFVQTLRLLIPLVVITILGAPYILHLFGSSYAAEGVTLLRLLCLSALPNIVTSLFISVTRVQRRMLALLLVMIWLCGMVFGLSYILLGVYGITGVGVAWLVGQSLVAVYLLLTEMRFLWLSQLDLSLVLRLLAGPRRWWWSWSRQHHTAKARHLVPQILPTISAQSDILSSITWRAQQIIPTVNDMTVITLGPTGEAPLAILKLPQTDYAKDSLHRQVAVLNHLQADTRLGNLLILLPTLLARGEIADQPYVVEKILPGLDARLVLRRPAYGERVLTSAATAISQLHQLTAVSVTVNAEMLEQWIDRPLAALRQINATHLHIARYDQALDRLASQLRNALAGRTLWISWVHGDFAPGNILVTSDGRTVTGIVDWDLAGPDDLPQLDIVQLLLASRMFVQSRELGDIVRDILDDSRWMPSEQAILNTAQAALPGDQLEWKTMVLLCWLRQVAANLTKSTRYKNHWLWITKNVKGVLDCL